jgi:hypothetical protein
MKRICFFIGKCDDRSGEWNGEIIRTGGVGVSGTDTSTVLIAEYFGSIGWDVTFISSTCKHRSTYNNVKYYSLDYFKEESANFNILVTPPYDEFLNYSWGALDTLIIWCHMQHTFVEASFKKFIHLYPNANIVINYMNNFTKLATNIHSPHTSFYINNEFLIPNPLLGDIVIKENIKKPHSFIFNTSYRRGGDVLINIFNKLSYSDKTLKICSAYKDELSFLESNNNIEILHSIDKSTLYNRLSESEYFIYPLVAPLAQGANLHKDCSPCSVAEALAHEVIVLTLPVAGLLDMYKDLLVFLPFPDESKKEHHQSGYHTPAPELYNIEFEEIVINTINFLENNPKYKELIKKRGKEFVLSQLELNLIGNKWLEHI